MMIRRAVAALVAIFLFVLFFAAAARAADGPSVRLKPETCPADFFLRATLPPDRDAASTVRLYFNLVDGANYGAVTLRGGKLTVERCRKGAAVENLGSGAAPAKAAEIVVRRRGGDVLVVADGELVARAQEKVLAGGRCGWDAGPGLAEPKSLVLQAAAPVVFSDDFMRSRTETGAWDEVAGRWVVDQVVQPQFSASPFRYLQEAPGAALTLCGYWFWDHLVVRAAVCPRGTAGLAFAVRDAADLCLFRWQADKQELQLVIRRGGRDQVVARRPARLVMGQWYAFSVKLDYGVAAAFVDGDEVLSARNPRFTCGRFGLASDGAPGATFDDVSVNDLDAVRKTAAVKPRVAAYFVSQESMRSWANPAGEWMRDPAGAGERGYRHTSTFFGDVTVRPRPQLGKQPDARLVVQLCTDRERPQAGYQLEMTPSPGGGMDLRLSRDGAEVARGKTTGAGDELVFALTGAVVSVDCGKDRAIEWTDPAPLTSGEVAVAARHADFDPARAEVMSPSMLDYTFAGAPVDWDTRIGRWDVANRWFCSPRYTWFAGQSETLAAAWNKYRFPSDVAVEIYAAPKMTPGAACGYPRPADLDITLAADGRSLSSGYSFLYGAEDNSVTRILGGSSVLAETREVLLPWNKGELHHRWHHVKAERRNGRLRMFVDGRLIMTVPEAGGVKGDRLALWTWHNALLFARVKITYAKREPAVLETKAPAPSVDAQGWRAAPGEATLRVEKGPPAREALAVTNAQMGGRFGIVRRPTKPARLADASVLNFDYRIPPDLSVDFYLHAHDRWWRLRFTGRPMPESDDMTLGWLPAIHADDAWHHVRCNLLDYFEPRYPDAGHWTVDEVRFENRDRRDYLGAGFGANPAGATWRLAGFSLDKPQPPAGATPKITSLPLRPDDAVRAWRIDDGGCGVDLQRTRVIVNGKAHAWGEPGLIVSPETGVLTADLGVLGHAFKQDEQVSVRLETALRGAAGPVTTAADEWRYDLKADKTAPAAPTVILPRPPLFAADYEDGVDGATGEPFASGARVERDPTVASQGRSSLLMRNDDNGGSFAVEIYGGAFDTRRYPAVAFDHLGTEESPRQVYVQVNGRWQRVATFAGAGASHWSQAVVNLQAAGAAGRGIMIGWPMAGAGGGARRRSGLVYHLDNVRLLAAQGANGEVRVRWHAADASGMRGYAVAFDRSPSTVPPEMPLTQDKERAFPVDVDGLWYVHVRAQDGAGLWSETVHVPVPVRIWHDQTPPEAQLVLPAQGADDGEGRLQVRLTDAGSGISTTDIRLDVGGRRYDLDDPGLTYDVTSGLLTWNAANVAVNPPAFRDGENVASRLEACDVAGNALAKPLTGSWVFRRAADRTAPAAPRVSFLLNDAVTRQDFEKGLGGVQSLRSGMARWSQGAAAVGTGYARLGGWTSLLHQGPFRVQRYPVLSFDYRIPSGQSILLGAEQDAYVYYAPLDQAASESVVADGRWRHVTVDLGRVVRNAGEAVGGMIVWAQKDWQAADSSVDNVCLGTFRDGVTLLWQPPGDASGIDGYAVVVDQAAATEPPATVTTRATTLKTGALKPGTWYAHVRARDAAGNWGPTAHLLIPVPADIRPGASTPQHVIGEIDPEDL